MKAVLTALIAAIEAIVLALVGVAVIAVPAILVWWLGFELAAEPQEVATMIAGVWLLAHFIPLSIEVAPDAALGFGLAPETLQFTLSLVPLGLTLLTVWRAARAGWRFADRGGAGYFGVMGGTFGFGIATALLARAAAPLLDWPEGLTVVVPALCFLLAASLGFVLRAATAKHPWWSRMLRAAQHRLEPLNSLWAAALPTRAAETLRLAAALLAATIGLAAFALACCLVVGYVGVVTLSERLQLDAVGVLVVFLVSLALVPVLVIWALAWISGAGFAIGIGTSVTPFDLLLGPLPAFPLFGAIPNDWGWAGGLAPALVVLLGACVGVYAGGRSSLRHSSLSASILVPLISVVLFGLAVVLLVAGASGSLGPGRLEAVGAHPWQVGGMIAAEVAIGLVPGVLATRLDLDRRIRAAQRRSVSGQQARAILSDRLAADEMFADDRDPEARRRAAEEALLQAFSWGEGVAPGTASQPDQRRQDDDWQTPRDSG